VYKFNTKLIFASGHTAIERYEVEPEDDGGYPMTLRVAYSTWEPPPLVDRVEGVPIPDEEGLAFEVVTFTHSRIDWTPEGYVHVYIEGD